MMERNNSTDLVAHAAAPPAQRKQSFLALAAEFWGMACKLAEARIVPQNFRGDPASCFLALEIAHRLKLGVFEIMQNLNIIDGKPGFSSAFAIAQANRLGPFDGPIRFRQEGQGEALAVTAYAKLRVSGEEVSFTASMAMARAEGWARNGEQTRSGKQKGNPKYDTIPVLMLTYRSGSLLIRTTCPEVLMGMQTVEEIEDVRYAGSYPSTPRDVQIEQAGPLERELAADPPGEPGGSEAGEGEAVAPQAGGDPAPAPTPIDPRPVVDAFAELRVKEDVLAAEIGCPLAEMTQEHRKHLLGVYKKLKALAPDDDPGAVFGEAARDAYDAAAVPQGTPTADTEAASDELWPDSREAYDD